MASQKPRQKKRHKLGLLQYDTNLIIAIIFLIVFGLIMIYSASYYTASTSQAYNYDPMYLLKRQLTLTIAGFAAMIVVANIDYHIWKKIAGLALLLSAGTILLLKVPGLGVTVKGATRWIKIGPIQFQAAEPVKVGMIIFLAAIIAKYGPEIRDFRKLARVMIPTVIVALMILKISDNMSTAIVLLGIAVIMVFMVHPKYWPFFAIAIVGGALVFAYIYYTIHFVPADAMEENFRITRIRAWLSPYDYEQSIGYQSLQALYAIGSGGFLGKGLGNSIQKLGRIPEPFNDMIFAIICEELGIFGASMIILLFAYTLYRIYTIAQTAEDLFGRLLAIGVFGHIALQVLLNIAVVTGVFPVTGVTLPFFSYGGTASAFLLVEIGIVLNVQKTGNRMREKAAREEGAS